MNGPIRISEKHGVNPTLMVCWLCGKDTNGIALLGRLPNDVKAPRQITDTEPCDTCAKFIAEGNVALLEATRRSAACHSSPPCTDASCGICETHRTGRMWIITGDAYARIFNVPRPERGICYIEPEVAKKLFGDSE